MTKNIFMFPFFKRYYYAETLAEKEDIFAEFVKVINGAGYDDFYTNKTSILEMIYDRKYIERCNFKEEEFKLAINSSLKKCFEKYIPPEEYESSEYNENRNSSLGKSNEDLLILYLGKHLFWYLIGWKEKYDSGNYVVCQVCGDLMKKGNISRNKKYCADCAKKVKLKQMRQINKRHYNSYKVKNDENTNE